jgi:hypothetical protein
MKGNAVEALHDPTNDEACILSEYLIGTLVGKKPQTLTNKYVRSPSGLFFECQGIARDVPITIDKIEVRLDFHVYDVIDFDLLLGYLLGKLLNTSQGSLDENLRETASAIATSYLENPMAKPHPKQNTLEKVTYGSPFISSKTVLFEAAKPATSKEYDSEEILHLGEDERSSSPSIEFEPLPVGSEYVVLDCDRDPTIIIHDQSLEMEDPWATEFCEVLTLESEGKDSMDKHERFILEIQQEPCSFNASRELAMLCAPSTYEDYNHLNILSCKRFRMHYGTNLAAKASTIINN